MSIIGKKTLKQLCGGFVINARQNLVTKLFLIGMNNLQDQTPHPND